MKQFKYILPIAIIIIFNMACNKSFLDRSNPSVIGGPAVWKDPVLVGLVVNGIYNDLPGWDYNTYNNIADEARSNYPGTAPNQILVGQWNDINNPMDVWANNYTSIRKCNDFLLNLKSASIDDAQKTEYTGEVRFLRAFFYWELVKRYGAVPLITQVQSLSDSLLVAKNTINDCFDFLAKQLDTAAVELAEAPSVKGRPSVGAALALKGRILLHYASPLYNTSNDLSRWSAAAAANKAVIDLGIYKLYPDLKRLWLDPANQESIFEVEYVMPEKNHGLDAKVKPLTIANGDAGQCSPLQELVDAFPMKNGKSINVAGSGYNLQAPYVGRDDRFYADIAYNGAVMTGTASGPPLKTLTLQIYKGGRDFDSVPSMQVYNTYTGYFCVKATDPDNTIYSYGYGSTQPWMEIRYAEVLLNYAEAQNEAVGPDQSVITALNEVRSRAGITTALTVGMNQADMRKLIHNERYIEFCFENKRYWDILRWKQAGHYLNGVQYTGVLTKRNNDGSFTYSYGNKVDGQPLIFDESKMYYMPIPHSEILKDPHLKQNPGWPK